VVENETFHSLEVFPFAVGAEDNDRVNFFVTKKSACSSLLRPLESYESESLSDKFRIIETIEVPVRRLDTLFNHGFDLLKIDAQGAGIDVLKGAQKILDTTKVVVVELEFIPLYREQALYHEGVNYMESQGFKIYKVQSVHALGEMGYTYCDVIFINERYHDISNELLNIVLPEDQQKNKRWIRVLKRYLDF
jgi:FkbM family methyltransferase